VVKCDRCGREISADDRYQHLGKVLCEDCYIDIRYPAKACDPWAVYSATKSRETVGLNGTAGLTDLQQAIYEFIRSKGKATREQLVENLDLTEADLQRQLATLRHCELVKGRKEGNSVYLVPFDYDEQDVDSTRREEDAQSKE
jgi:DNA-binding transcriptional ArsR family regulator